MSSLHRNYANRHFTDRTERPEENVTYLSEAFVGSVNMSTVMILANTRTGIHSTTYTPARAHTHTHTQVNHISNPISSIYKNIRVPIGSFLPLSLFHQVRSEIFTAMSMKNVVFWSVTQPGSCKF
jgi:hypothetical protein